MFLCQLIRGIFDIRLKLSCDVMDRPSFWHGKGVEFRRTEVLDIWQLAFAAYRVDARMKVCFWFRARGIAVAFELWSR